VCGGQPSPHKPRLVVSHSTCPPLSSSPHAHSFVLGTAVINKTSRSYSVKLGTRPRPRQAAAAVAGGDGAREARTGSRPKRTCCDTPATARLRRGRPLTTLQPTKRQPATTGAVELGGRITTRSVPGPLLIFGPNSCAPRSGATSFVTNTSLKQILSKTSPALGAYCLTHTQASWCRTWRTCSRRLLRPVCSDTPVAADVWRRRWVRGVRLRAVPS
jgi:hypothetical protein